VHPDALNIGSYLLEIVILIGLVGELRMGDCSSFFHIFVNNSECTDCPSVFWDMQKHNLFH